MMEITDVDLALQEEARHLAEQVFGSDIKKCLSFTNWLLDIYARAQGKDFLLIHNPGGRGCTPLEQLLQWEKSIVEGVSATIEQLGYSWLLTQHFRSGKAWWEWIGDIREQARFFATKAKVLVAELRFITQHVSNLKVIQIGASQGAAFSNTVMQQLGDSHQVYSIELGAVFLRKPRQVVTERTLVINSNGVVPDAMMDWNIAAITKAYFIAPFKWIKSRLKGKPARFFDCVNVRGHEYGWEYPEVRRQITDFLTTNFGTDIKLEGGLS